MTWKNSKLLYLKKSLELSRKIKDVPKSFENEVYISNGT